MRAESSSGRLPIEEAQLPCAFTEQLNVGLQLAQPQQFTTRIETLPHHSDTRWIDGSDFCVTLRLVHCQNRLAGKVCNVQQIGAVAGDYDLTLPARFP